MKNIYEDGNNRHNMDDINSGEDDLGHFAPPAENLEPPAVPVPEQASVPGQQPSINLTPDQLTALITQILAAQTPPQQSAQPTGIIPQPPAAVTPPAGSVDTGKRILYQSSDFDDVSDKREPEKSDEDRTDEQTKQSFYDDDDMFDDEQVGREELLTAINAGKFPSSVKTTELGGSFSVAEIEVDNSDLPEIRPARVVRSKNAQPESPASADEPFQAPAPSDEVSMTEEEEEQLPEAEQALPEEQSEQPAQSPSRTFVPSIEIEEVEFSLNDDSRKAKKKKLDTGEIIRRTVLAVAILAIVIASAVLIREYYLHKQNQNLEEDVQNLIVDVVEPTKKKNKNKNTDTQQKDNDAEQKDTAVALTPEQQWAQIRAEYPNVIFPPNIQLKYAKLYATNQDFVGYLSADGVNLNLPIVQAADDEKYLTKNFYGANTKYGCPFVTHVNNITNFDINTIIFGHHMNDGTVFGALDAYKTIDGFKSAPVITFNTLYADYQWKVVAAFITNAFEEEDDGYVFKYYFASLSTQERFAAYLNEIAQRSLYDTGVDVLPTDKLLTLSTCSHEFNEARFVVVARLVRPGESAKVDVSKASVNSSPRYPQAYYEKKKLENPYKNAIRWEVG